MKGGRKRREPTRSGAEVDVIRAKRMYAYMQRPGVSAGIKRGIRRRERHKTEEE